MKRSRPYQWISTGKGTGYRVPDPDVLTEKLTKMAYEWLTSNDRPGESPQQSLVKLLRRAVRMGA